MAAKKKKLFFCFHSYREGYLWSSEDDLSIDHGDDVPAKKPKDVPTLEKLFTTPRPDVEGFTCVSSGSKIFVIGGYDAVKRVATDEVYWIDTDTSSPSHYQWQKLPSMNAKRSSPAAAVVDGKIFVMGSELDFTEEVNVIPYGEFFDLNKKPSESKWEAMVSPLDMKQRIFDTDPANQKEAHQKGWKELGWDYTPSRLCFKNYPSVYNTTLHAVDDNKIYVNVETGIPPFNLSYDLKGKAWGADGIPLPTGEYERPYNNGRNVILDGVYYLIFKGGVWSFPLTEDATQLVMSGLNYELGSLEETNFPQNIPKPVLLATLPPDIRAVAIDSTVHLFHLGNGDMCLVPEDSGRLLWCQFLQVSLGRVKFGRLKKYSIMGRLLDCLLVMSATASDADSSSLADDKSPLWRYFTKLGKSGKGGGNSTFKCNLCNGTFSGSYSRVRAHLLKITGIGVAPCVKVTSEIRAEMQRVMEEAELRIKQSKLRHVPLPASSILGGSSSGASSGNVQYPFDSMKKRKGPVGPLEKAFNMETREQLNGEIARMFYTGGLSFQLARNPHYMRAFSLATNRQIQGYTPPGYNILRTTLLQKERSNIERQLEPIKKAWPGKGVTVCSDGWSDAQRRPLINIMAVSEGGPMFIKAVNCEGEYKDKYFISNLLIEAIQEIGPSSVVQVITDNAENCKAGGLLVENKFPHIFWTPCVVHTLNLALKNICAPKPDEVNEEVWKECSWILDISTDALFIKNFIMNHGMRLNMFNENNDLKLLTIANTRFASTVVMLKRFKKLKQGLQRMVISERWDLYKEDDVGKAKTVKDKLLDDDFWDQVDYILDFTGPIYEMLRYADTDMPCLHLVYEWWDTMIEKVKESIYRHEGKGFTEESKFFDVVYTILVKRWNKSNTPLHCLAHSLNPKYYSPEWLGEVPGRVSPQGDAEIARERKKCIERYFPNEVERRMVNMEFASFSSSLNDFSCPDSMRDRAYMTPQQWWACHGASTPTLQSLAMKLLGQPCSSSCCERNWSTYKFIHSVKRNKIVPQRAEDLVFVHNNLRLLSRRSPQYKEGSTKLWDVGGDDFDSMDLDSGILEVANLSLDEPELEGVVFTDNDGEMQTQGARDDEE